MFKDLIIKVCGMRDPNNIKELGRIGVDWMGFIHYPKSKRFVQMVVDPKLKLGHKWVGVFVDETLENVIRHIEKYNLDMVQLHGEESPEYCKSILDNGIKVLKAFSINEEFDFTVCNTYEQCVDYFLFDASGELPGGNGVTYDWAILQKYQGKVPFLLSGGIGPDLIPQLKQFEHPQWMGIDINSRFEISPALKDIEQIRKFKYELLS